MVVKCDRLRIGAYKFVSGNGWELSSCLRFKSVWSESNRCWCRWSSSRRFANGIPSIRRPSFSENRNSPSGNGHASGEFTLRSEDRVVVSIRVGLSAIPNYCGIKVRGCCRSFQAAGMSEAEQAFWSEYAFDIFNRSSEQCLWRYSMRVVIRPEICKRLRG